MAKTPPPADKPSLTKPEMAQQIANVTGFGIGWISERLEAAEAWDVAAEWLAMGDVAEVAALINPANKAT